MYCTTLRIPDELATYVQEAAQAASLSVNAWLAQLLEQDQAQARKRRLAQDWAVYAGDTQAQDVEYAVAAQGQLVAERAVATYRAGKGARTAPKKSGSKP
jgi:hypothetical protein